MRATAAAASPSRLLSACSRLAAPSAAPSDAWIRAANPPFRDRRIDLESAGDDEARLVRHRQRLQRVAFEQGVHRVGEIGRASALARKARENAPLAAARRTASALRLVQTPRPGSLRRMSGTTAPSGREREAQHRLGRTFGPRRDAGPLRPAVVVARVLIAIRRFLRPRQAASPSSCPASPSGAGSGASIQPARTRASRIMASACARVTSKPAR